MKKIYLTIYLMVVLVITNAFCQKPSMELTFTADNNGQPVALDSILIQNLTQGGDTTLYSPNNIFVLNYTLGIPDISGSRKNTFTLFQNYPNPFSEQTTINIYLPQKDHLRLNVFNFLGQQVAFYEKTLNGGQHSFTFYPGKEIYYLFTAIGNNATRAIKMVSLNSKGDDNCRIVFTGNEDDAISLKSSQNINNFGFNLGDELMFVGYTVLWQAFFNDSPLGDTIYEFQYATGIPCPGAPSITYEGQSYNTVQIGNQCWFKENLNIGTMIDGGNNQLNNGIIEKYCYNNDPANCAIYGGLYQWDEMMQYSTQSGTQGICPNGWHIPTDEDWCETSQYIDPTVNCEWEDWSGTDVGTKMKSTSGWNSGGNGSNSSGFTALPGGGNLSSFFYLGLASRFWTSTQFDFNESWDRMLRMDYENISRGYFDKEYGFSVRCIRDN